MPSYRAVLFDLDGTLLDTLDDLADSANAVLAAMGHPTHPRDSYRYFVGNGIEHLVRSILPAGSDPAQVRRCLNGMKEEYSRRWRDKTALYPGIAEMLDGLSAAGLILTILSNKPDPFTQETVRHFLSPWSFARVAGARPGVAVKPDPAGALELARGVGVAPDEFLYLGDTNTDMQTAVGAGMHPVGVLWGFRGAEELRAAGAAHLVDHPRQVLDLLS